VTSPHRMFLHVCKRRAEIERRLSDNLLLCVKYGFCPIFSHGIYKGTIYIEYVMIALLLIIREGVESHLECQTKRTFLHHCNHAKRTLDVSTTHCTGTLPLAPPSPKYSTISTANKILLRGFCSGITFFRNVERRQLSCSFFSFLT